MFIIWYDCQEGPIAEIFTNETEAAKYFWKLIAAGMDPQMEDCTK